MKFQVKCLIEIELFDGIQKTPTEIFKDLEIVPQFTTTDENFMDYVAFEYIVTNQIVTVVEE